MRDENGRHITGTIPEDEEEAREAAKELRRSRGLGDTVANFAKMIGADKVAEAYTRVTGKDCGCEQRRETLNRLFPYRKS